MCRELVKYVRKLRWGLGDATSDVNDDDIDYGEGKDNGDDEADQEDDHNDGHDEIIWFSTTCDNHVYGRLSVEMLNDHHPQVIPPPTTSYGKAPGDVKRDVGKLLQHALNIAGRGALTW